MDFAVPANTRVYSKENEKLNEYRNMVKVIMIVTVILIPVGGKLKTRGRIKTVHTTALLRPARKLRRVPNNWKDFLSNEGNQFETYWTPPPLASEMTDVSSICGGIIDRWQIKGQDYQDNAREKVKIKQSLVDWLYAVTLDLRDFVKRHAGHSWRSKDELKSGVFSNTWTCQY